ncbi:ATP-binding protein [Cohaesibacter haloalkalitolerans]|uniref:ATP-binding protein n=1 Tax=Cohaesibacter haloalkalitolerans TaxID=1162980 RepID=UPI000E64FB37|nr:ATP-binding protein [Cohaesibacter haloalkalitolerans]
MSSVNIKRVVENIRSGTTVYTPIVEAIVNAIQAIDAKPDHKGKISIKVQRSKQQELEGGKPKVESFVIEDDGIGFNESNRDSFDTLYTDHKIAQGGKGFGRFTCLKYFNDLTVNSVFRSGDVYKQRSFKMGKSKDIIINEVVQETDQLNTGSTVTLKSAIGRGFSDKKIQTIARTLVEKLLPYFIDADYSCPRISISEKDGSGVIVLNDFVDNQLSGMFSEIPLDNQIFELGGTDDTKAFFVRVFKIYSPKSQKSKISLVADRREVTDTAIHNYVPEFIDEFFDAPTELDAGDRNYIVKAYVFGDYLDKNVSLERGGFDFPKDGDIFSQLSQVEIEKTAAAIARDALGETIIARQEKKIKRVHEYVDEIAPWHKTIIDEVDLSLMPYNPTADQIETALQKEKFSQEVTLRKKVHHMLSNVDADQLAEGLSPIVEQISKTSKNDLAHYIALRKHVLSLFSRSLELNENEKYASEAAVHDIIFPRKKGSSDCSLDDHNLWIIDERLNFTNFVNSDKPLGSGNKDRPDLLVFDRPVLFRGDNEASNPITVFEFKKPGRDDFVNPSSKEDPVQQIIRYVNNVKKGNYKTPKGRPMNVASNTPFYGYVMCELSEKVTEWLEFEKNFTPMPDRMGWFNWFGNNNLYMEVLSWDKVLNDAEMRNKLFFQKLGI